MLHKYLSWLTSETYMLTSAMYLRVTEVKLMDEKKLCIQCNKPVMPGEEYCEKCIIEDAKTMGVIE